METVSACNDHIGGILGNRIYGAYKKEGFFLVMDDDGTLYITERGRDELESIGVDVLALKRMKEKPAIGCTQAYKGAKFEHIGGALGARMKDAFITRGWLSEHGKGKTKKLKITKEGLKEFHARGIDV